MDHLLKQQGEIKTIGKLTSAFTNLAWNGRLPKLDEF